MKLFNLYSTDTAYRGIAYDPHAKKKVETHTVIETYRGIKHEEKVEVAK
jgi:hypothetical protein